MGLITVWCWPRMSSTTRPILWPSARTMTTRRRATSLRERNPEHFRPDRQRAPFRSRIVQHRAARRVAGQFSGQIEFDTFIDGDQRHDDRCRSPNWTKSPSMIASVRGRRKDNQGALTAPRRSPRPSRAAR